VSVFVGVDIGLDGGLGVLIDGLPPQVFKMPTLTIERKGARKKREIDFDHLRRIFATIKVKFDDVFVILEKPQLRPAMIKKENPHTGAEEWVPNQGIVSQVNFMGQYRELRGLLRGLGIAQTDIHPATWKADVFHGQGERGKDAARQKAAMMFPVIADKFKAKNSDGLAEAILLADYARRRHGAPF
jgi:hypothetical protein